MKFYFYLKRMKYKGVINVTRSANIHSIEKKN